MNSAVWTARLAAAFSFVFIFPVFGQAQWQPMIDTELSQWESYLSYQFELGYDGTIPKDEHGNNIAPIGLLPQPQDYDVFTVATEDNKPEVLRVSGEIYGGLTTKRTYRNYHLKLKMKWGEDVYPPREKLLKDSGILYHGIGEHGGEYWRSWLISQEFQIMRGHIGDYWNQSTTAIDVRAFLPEYIMNPVADESQPFISVGRGQDIQGFVLRKENNEKDEGEWNDLELICFEGKSLHIVNGEVVMVLKNSRNIDEKGIASPLAEGRIQIQSEAAEVYYKDIFIREISSIPESYKSLY